LASLAILQSFVVQLARRLHRRRVGIQASQGISLQILSARNAHDSPIGAEQPFLNRRESLQMKAQFIEPETVAELAPRILHPKKILVPIDFSATSKKAFQYALRFGEQFGCEIVLLHVIEPVEAIAGTPLAVDIFAQPEEDTIAAEAELASLVASSRSRQNSFTPAVRTGHAPNEITKAAKELDVDLIVIATHGYTSWRHLCIGSTAERVVHTAPCPVLVVREKEHDFITT
jgi:universal stress protein A